MFLRLASSNKRRRASSENTEGIGGEEPPLYNTVPTDFYGWVGSGDEWPRTKVWIVYDLRSSLLTLDNAQGELGSVLAQSQPSKIGIQDVGLGYSS